MKVNAIERTVRWARHAGELDGPGFASFQRELTRYNAVRTHCSVRGAIDGDVRR